MPKFTIDGIEYNSEDLSDEAKGELASLQFVEKQIIKIDNEIALYKKAQELYFLVLKKDLDQIDAKSEEA